MPNDGVSATIKLWVVLLVVFTLLGYPPLFATVLGAMGGFAGGVIVAYWIRKDQTPPKAVEVEQTDNMSRGLRPRLFRRQQTEQPRTETIPWWERLFRRRRGPTFRSRRDKSS